ncbi:uncharacterized protein LOC128245853 [Mya arenaria]|uniref:uncharacterized protein LOC128245853 n=1 Tax=Mya arenaria TaxID=6604 RepID=UPI0022E2DCC0|nr:uncharacterized protein LOC128245853 [Mya arenaria]
MYARLVVLAFILKDAQWISAETGPTECTYSDDVYTCDYASMTSSDRPIEYNDFTTVPQRLTLTLNGLLPYIGDGRVFSTGFDTIPENQFDSNHPAALTIDCGWAGSAYIDRGSFYHMEYVQWFKVRNCDVLYIGTDTIDIFTQLDYFSFEGGSIDFIDVGVLYNLSVERLTSGLHQFPRTQGRFEVLYSQFVDGTVTTGLLYFFKNLTSVALRGANISSLTTDTFAYNLQLTSIDLSDNTFTELPGEIFKGLDKLAEVTLFNIDWYCSCDQLVWLEDALDDNITIHGDLMCVDQTEQSVLKFYYTNCVETAVCNGKSGFAIGSYCQSILGVFMIGVAFLTLLLIGLSTLVAFLNRQMIPRAQYEMGIKLRKRARKAREQWRDAKRMVLKKIRADRGLPTFPISDEIPYLEDNSFSPEQFQYNNAYEHYNDNEISSPSPQFYHVQEYQSPGSTQSYNY